MDTASPLRIRKSGQAFGQGGRKSGFPNEE